MIQELRDDVIDNKNTAQQRFLDLLDTTIPTIDDFYIHESLSGDLDLEVIDKCDFKNISGIIFSPGQITSIRNIPKKLKKIVCPENLLIDLENIPQTIEILEIPNNAIQHIDFKPLVYLKTLDITANQFQVIQHLPNTIESILCDNNQIRRIDLANTTLLKTLHCSNNGLVTVENFPDTITDFQMDNNPLLEIQRKGISTHAHSRHPSHSIKYAESLQKYFELKSKYETKVRESRKKLFQRLGPKLAKSELEEWIPPCINCKRPVGTVFITENRHYKAHCGDPIESTRCMDIDIYAGEYNSIHDAIDAFKEGITMNKENIIKMKLDTLFGYTQEDDSIQKFKEEMDEYTENNMILKQIKDKYTDLYDNPHTIEKISDKKKQLFEIHERILALYKEYRETENPDILKMAMHIHTTEYLPEIKNLRIMKYEIMDIVENEDEYFLFQRPIGIHKQNFTFGEHPRVIKFHLTGK